MSYAAKLGSNIIHHPHTKTMGQLPRSQPSPMKIIIKESSFHYLGTHLRSDVCGLSSYEELSDFLPNRLDISNSKEAHFNIDTDIQCHRYGSENRKFTCDEQKLTRTSIVPFFGQVTMNLNNTTSGKILSEHAIELKFEVSVQDCTDNQAGCFAVGLGLDLPCKLTLETIAVY